MNADGQLFSWGRNLYGALGDGTLVHTSSPALVTGFRSPVLSFTAGGCFVCAITVFKEVQCIGGIGYASALLKLPNGSVMLNSTSAVTVAGFDASNPTKTASSISASH